MKVAASISVCRLAPKHALNIDGIKDEVETLPEWVKQFYQIRCKADGIVFSPKRMIDESIVTLIKN